jgi:dihydrofolate synthase/folylpolyglutamate synthase
MGIESAIDNLYSLQKFGIKLGLTNIENFLNYLGNPHRNFRSIHIAGSNGKGSTASFIASILTEVGYKAGLYTSPNFVKFNERIKIKNFEIPDDYIVGFISEYFNYIRQNNLTFFEATTALAFKYFNDNEIEFGVIETGLGGRLDATNVIQPMAAVITSISYEHTEILGETIEQIAEEKAGIIKRAGNVFIGRLPMEAEIIIAKKCDSLGNNLFKISDYIVEKDSCINFISSKAKMENLSVPLKGQYQKYNASLALLTVSETLGITDVKLLNRGIKNVLSNTGLQGRYEIYNENPKVIFDSAHNIEGVKSFLESFAEEAGNYDKRILIFGAMRDKAIKEMLQLSIPYFDEFYFTEIDLDRCAKADELYKIAMELNIKSLVELDTEFFISNFIAKKNNNCLVVLGSMYILGSIKEKLLYKN